MRDKLCFVTAICSKDIHYARALLASIRFFYPDYPIIILADRDLSKNQIKNLSKFPNTKVFRTSELAKKNKLPLEGLLSKLNLFFFNNYLYYFFLDADSILISPILDKISLTFDFICLSSRKLDLSKNHDKMLFNRYAVNLDKIKEMDPDFAKITTPFLISSGHFISKPNPLFKKCIRQYASSLDTNWTKKNKIFFGGDQGFINYIINKYSGNTLSVDFKSFNTTEEKWASNYYSSITLPNIKSKKDIEKSIIHYTGPCRYHFLRKHYFGDILTFFYNLYYKDSSPWQYFLDVFKRYLVFGTRKLLKKITFKIKRKAPTHS